MMDELINAYNLIKKSKDNINLLDNISMDILKGDKISLSGRSGSGKSLFLRAIAGLDHIDSGEILWKKENINNLYAPFYRSKVIYLHQKPVIFDGTAEYNLKKVFELHIHNDKTFDKNKILKYLELVDRNENFLEKLNINLSGGESQILAVLRVLQLEPEILLLDEPTSALDYESTIAVEKLISNWFSNEKAFIWVSHDKLQQRRVSNKNIDMAEGHILLTSNDF